MKELKEKREVKYLEMDSLNDQEQKCDSLNEYGYVLGGLKKKPSFDYSKYKNKVNFDFMNQFK